uniref:Uncharacterized protein n=1 Tax=Rhizophora mucronata TaxID=61149 RepID=A0A2P2K3W3_RHIMU
MIWFTLFVNWLRGWCWC